MVAETEGVFCEPASAASIAGVVKLGTEGFFRPGQRLVCTLTGHGLKDPDNAIAQSVRRDDSRISRRPQDPRF